MIVTDGRLLDIPETVQAAIRRAYARLPKDRKGKVERGGHVRALLLDFGITRGQLYRIVKC